ncbi:hypothetical protein NW249_23960 [Streptomyces sp. OUCMDZ-4982]|uniref:hypothetical protein n=1 Tax=Streptomyces sp. OUCMDZ-4982 TaxID=2973090 RepID=UPI00215C2DD3|nr:hypothetical protein [Streptomyces sp. OUCMDZ-4982]MCR8945176.1 hypothetical protein [Streptomyces sp. OUCMDZ-4982]
MTTQLDPERTGTGVRYALIAAHGCDIGMLTVESMLNDDPEEEEDVARYLPTGAPLPMGALPVIVADTTVYGAVRVEQLLQLWPAELPRPYLITVADAPSAPPSSARYRIRALGARLVGTARVPYLPVLRTVTGPADAMTHQDVSAAAVKLRRHLEGL